MSGLAKGNRKAGLDATIGSKFLAVTTSILPKRER